MNKHLYIGCLANEGNGFKTPVYINEEVQMNDHFALLGRSGCGKTTSMLQLAISKAERGDAVIIFDYNNIFAEDQILSDFLPKLNALRNDIDVYNDGFTCDILRPVTRRDGSEEHPDDVAEGFAEVLGRNMKCRGPIQMARLKEAASLAIEYYDERGISAVGDILSQHENAQSIALLDKLGSFFRHNIFRPGRFPIMEGCLNIIRLSNFPVSLQYATTELILSYLYRRASANALLTGKTSIFIDEAQNISGAQGIVSSLLTEGRKYGISVTVATQSLKQIQTSKVLGSLFQASSLFLFQPARNEINEIARYIDPSRATKWILRLKGLNIGEFIAIAPLVIGKQQIDRPVMVKTVFTDM